MRWARNALSAIFLGMTDGTQSPPAGTAPPAGGTPPPDGGTPPAPQRPDYIPEQFWDADGGAVKAEFGQHYSELATFKQTYDQTQEALKARKPEDIKIEVKLPETVKVPEGMEIKVDEKDPRIPVIREMALKNGWDQDAVNALVALDAQQKIDEHNVEMQRVAAEDAKLGANGKDRKDAAAAWVSNFKDLTAEEREEINVLTATAAGVTLLEKLIAKSNGSVPTTVDPPPPSKPAEVPIEQRWYGGSQQKAS